MSSLNEHHQRHIRATCQYIDRLLGDLENIASGTAKHSAFARYVDDLSAAEKRDLGERSAEIRAHMLRVMRGLGIEREDAPTSARYAVRSGLNFIEIALEELRPQHMKGYGVVPPDANAELHGLVQELQGFVHRFDAALVDAASTEGSAPAAANAARPAAPPVNVDPAPIEAELRRTAALFEDVRKLCEALRDPSDRAVFEALELAADRAAKALDYPSSHPDGVDGAVRAAITQSATDRTDDIRRPLEIFVSKVHDVSREAARAVGLPEPASAAEWHRLARAAPAFDFGDVHVDVNLFLRKMLGAGVAHTRMRSAIESQVGGRITRAVNAHGLALHEWSLGVLARVDADFHAHAATVRARLSNR